MHISLNLFIRDVTLRAICRFVQANVWMYPAVHRVVKPVFLAPDMDALLVREADITFR